MNPHWKDLTMNTTEVKETVTAIAGKTLAFANGVAFVGIATAAAATRKVADLPEKALLRLFK